MSSALCWFSIDWHRYFWSMLYYRHIHSPRTLWEPERILVNNCVLLAIMTWVLEDLTFFPGVTNRDCPCLLTVSYLQFQEELSHCFPPPRNKIGNLFCTLRIRLFSIIPKVMLFRSVAFRVVMTSLCETTLVHIAGVLYLRGLSILQNTVILTKSTPWIIPANLTTFIYWPLRMKMPLFRHHSLLTRIMDLRSFKAKDLPEHFLLILWQKATSSAFFRRNTNLVWGPMGRCTCVRWVRPSNWAHVLVRRLVDTMWLTH